jgi:uncharacterized protein (DUF1778 family)
MRPALIRYPISLLGVSVLAGWFDVLLANLGFTPYNCPYIERNVMAVKTDRMEARVSPEERQRIEQASVVVGVSVSAFMVNAAVDRADEVISQAATTTVPAGYFDALLAALDDPEPAPRLSSAVSKAARSKRIRDR